MKKVLCIIAPIFTVAYSLLYASLGGFSGNRSALSKIGLEHPLLFTIWGITTAFTLFSNIIIGFKRTKYKFYIALLSIAAIGMLLTLCFDFDYSKYAQYILHCVGSLTFSAVTGTTVFLLFLLTKNYPFAVISALILIADLILLLIFKETALIELMPIFAGYIMLSVHNLRKEKEKIELIGKA